jgi:alcohol dehydrogenase
MKAALFENFGGSLRIREVADPEPHPDAVLVRVRACGICRSDWHAWMGHDSGVTVPHVPGHELAGTVAALGSAVNDFRLGQRVTVPFCCGCGSCDQCRDGDPQVCPSQTQPGFTHWGAFAELVEIRHADVNLVPLPEQIDFVTAASLGCRFATSFRALVHQARLDRDQWLAVHGCGGVGLSAVMVGQALGAHVIAIDIRPQRLDKARQLGAAEVVDGSRAEVPERIRQITGGGAQVSIDALGSPATCANSLLCLAPRGRHIQVGLLLGEQSHPPLPMAPLIANELEIYGSHGMQAAAYPQMLEMIKRGRLTPQQLVSDVVSLEQGARLLEQLDTFPHAAISVIELS